MSAFENFFSNIPLDITNKLNSSSMIAEQLLKRFYKHPVPDFKFEYIRNIDIENAFKQLDIKNTEDLWGVSVKVLQSIIVTISPVLVIIFNQCVDQGQFPDLMKHSKVVPIFKSGSKNSPSNFRPVSVLPALSKIFEKIMLKQLLSHFNKHRILHDHQFGFTKGRSTTDAAAKLLTYIFEAWERSQDAIGIFCDLSKAFDCVDHQTLICKLHHYGVRGTALGLVLSYLSHRKQHVGLNGITSPGSVVKMGVPQGSILGPFLFLVYINDLPYMVKEMSDIVLFADDTSLIFKINRRDKDVTALNNSLDVVCKWFAANNLVLNADKTKCLKFSLPNVAQVDTKIMLDGNTLEIVDKTVFLGITIDHKLQWGAHIEALSVRLSSAAFAVRKIRQLTDIATARLVYFAYFHSVMSYGILLWGSAAEIETIFILQKRAIRAIYNMKPRESLRNFFKEINILTLPSLYIFENIMFIRKNLSLYETKSCHHNFNTRNKCKIAVPQFRLTKTNKSFLGNGIRFYNKIPKSITALTEMKFKAYVKDVLIRKAYYRVDHYVEDRDVWK